MEPILGRKILNEFKYRFPIYGPRVVKWRPFGLFGVKLWMVDNNQFIFSHTGRRSQLWTMIDGKKKGRLIYDSKNDHRKGV